MGGHCKLRSHVTVLQVSFVKCGIKLPAAKKGCLLVERWGVIPKVPTPGDPC